MVEPATVAQTYQFYSKWPFKRRPAVPPQP